MSCMAGPSGGEEKPGFMVSSSSGLAEYCYSTDHVSSSSGNQSIHHQSITHLMGQLQQSSFEPNPEIYSTMEMVGFPSPAWNHQQNQNSSSTAIYPSEIRQNIIQGLSLSLNSSSNPPIIGDVNSFQLRQNEHNGLISFGPSSSSSRPVNNILQIRDSRYLGPAQELLNEFCNIGIHINDDDGEVTPKLVKAQKTNSQRQDDHIKMQSLYSLDLLELHNRKSKLLLMLQEVDKRYKHYCSQMKAVVSSFEEVAGNGAATVYSALASRAMSRHFRSLKDGIVNEINATKKAMGEKDSTTSSAPGTTKGETPRLRLLDQTLRQQKSFQQMGMTECHPWRPQRGLPERSVSVLRAWLFEHFLHPYPSDVDKHILARQTGLSRSQVSNWFINARVRLWKPMVEEMYVEELKEQEGALDLDAVNPDENSEMQNGQDFSRNDQKPSHDQLFRIDSDCLSSIININSSDKCDGINRKGKGLIGNSSSYGAMELDFSSYGQHHSAVSLTLGLHQHGGSSGVNLAYPHGQSTQSSSNFDHHNGMEDWQTVHHEYSNLLDSESQTVPYRNLMDSQLLHDFNG